MLSHVQSRCRLLAQLAFCAANVVGLLAGLVYKYRTPDLYENQKHGPIGWTAAIVSFLWLAPSILLPQLRDESGFSRTNLASEFRPLQDRRSWSHDSERGSARPVRNLLTHDSSSTQTLLREDGEVEYGGEEETALGIPKKIKTNEGLVGMSCSSLHTMSWLSAYPRTQKALWASKIMFDFTMLPLCFVCVATGLVVYGGIFVCVISPSLYLDREESC